LDLPCTIGLNKSPASWTSMDYQTLQRISDGLFAVFMSLRKIPNIRYLAGSECCQKLALELNVFY
jgi:hypothetical protein